MTISRRTSGSWLLGLFALTLASTAQAQSDDDVPLIMLKPQGAGALSRPRLNKLYEAIKKHSARARGQILPLTKTEVWMVPQASVEDVRKTASRRGVAMNRLSEAWSQLFRKAPDDARLGNKQRSVMDRARASLAAIGVGMMTAPRPPLVEYALTRDAPGSGASGNAPTITVALNDSAPLTLRRTRVELRSDMYVWRGTVDGTDEPATLMWWPDGRMVGTVQHNGRIYSLRHLGGELHAVVELAENRMPQEHSPADQRRRADDRRSRDASLGQRNDARGGRINKPSAPKPPQGEGVDQTASSQDIVIDLIVAYTKKAAGNYVDIRSELIKLAIDEANESFRLSNLANVKLRLAHTYETNYVEEGGHFDHVWRFADKGDGHMEEVHALRDKHRADVAILIVDDSDGCGLATRVYADATDAFAVVHHECAATTYSLAHEVGHLIGARHDLNMDSTMTPFAFGHGYVNGKKWRDIMSYRRSCDGCRRIPVWSSPLVQVRDEPAGTPELDNARVIREQAARVAAFR